MEDKVIELLNQFDVLLTEIALLSIQDIQLIVSEICHKLEDIKSEIGDSAAAGHPKLQTPFLAELDNTTATRIVGDSGQCQNEIVVILDENNLKIEDLGDDDFHGRTVDGEGGFPCLYNLSDSRTSFSNSDDYGRDEENVRAKVFHVVDCDGLADEENDEDGGLDDDERVDSYSDPSGGVYDPGATPAVPVSGRVQYRVLQTACPQCGKECVTKRALNAHLAEVHPALAASVAVFSCRICSKEFRSPNGLRYHMEVKHDPPPAEGAVEYSCERPDCGYKTSSRVLLRAHRYSHTTNAPLTCPVCGKDFLGGAKALEQHLKIHTSSRDYRCQLCDKSFVNQSRLTYHMGNVHEEPRYHCDQCSKTFRSKANFERHQRIHTDEKPFVCRFCGFRCNHSTNLTSHVRTIHKEASFTTGKLAKQAKRQSLLKEILKAKSTTGEAVNSVDSQQISEDEASLLPISLGLDVLKRLECQGKIVTDGMVPQRRTVRESGARKLKRQEPTVAREMSLIRSRRSREQIFTVTNSRGDIVEALVNLDVLDEESPYS